MEMPAWLIFILCHSTLSAFNYYCVVVGTVSLSLSLSSLSLLDDGVFRVGLNPHATEGRDSGREGISWQHHSCDGDQSLQVRARRR